jgi:hypothetical protein
LTNTPCIDLLAILTPDDQQLRSSINGWGRLNTTDKPSLADFALVPHEVAKLINNKDYIQQLKRLSTDLPLVVFNTGDKSPNLNFRNVLQIRTFLHPWESQNNKIVVPYPAEPKKLEFRDWSDIPTISFMGYVPRLSVGSLFGNSFRSLRHPIKSSVFLNRRIVTHRLHSMSGKLNVRLCARSSFSGNKSAWGFEKLQIEFEQDLIASDYVFCPRGFGNTSIRFFETLSAGRIPVTINTNTPLPVLSSGYLWEDYALNLNMFDNWEGKILDHWNSQVRRDTYHQRQLKASNLFYSDLEYRKVLKNLFEDYLL